MTDVTDASGTGLFSIRERRWAEDLIKSLGIPFTLFPDVYESPEITGVVQKRVATEVGIKSGIPFVGGGDAVVQKIGVGAISSNIISINRGRRE